jgi:predicted acetyltransferase
MAIDVRRLAGDAPAEVAQFLRANAVAMGRSPAPANAALAPTLSPTVEPDRCLVAVDGDQVVGTAQARTFTLSVPGGRDHVPTAGIGGIGVLPTHRRQGILRRLMDEQLGDAHDRGEALACLWSTEAAIYPRFGFGVGTFGHRVNVERPAPRVTADTGGVRVRLLDGDATKVVATAAPVYERLRTLVPGVVNRSAAFWSTRWDDPTMLVVVAEGAGGDGVDGYCRYSTTATWCELGPANDLHVDELVACTPAARAALWRYLFEVDLVARWSVWHSAPQDALPLLVDDIRSLRLTLSDGLWLRIVDLPAAIAARDYGPTGLDVVVHVRDSTCPWNDGTWHLTDDGATRENSNDNGAALTMDAADLASAYLGGSTIADLARAGRVDEHRRGAVAHVDAAFRWPTLPWAVTWF